MSEIKNLEPFSQILARAAERKGSVDYVLDIAGGSLPSDMLAKIPNDRWLAAFTKQVFQSGFVWRVVEDKWSGFEEVFFQFDFEMMLMMPDEMWEAKCKDMVTGLVVTPVLMHCAEWVSIPLLSVKTMRPTSELIS